MGNQAEQRLLDMQAISDTLIEAQKYRLETEVMYSALKNVQDGMSIQDALHDALSEWDI